MKCGKIHSQIYIPIDQMSFLQKRMYEILDKSLFINQIPNILKDLSEKFNKIKDKGINKDKLEWNKESEQYILNEVLKTGVE
jgi:hypothetical protein